MTRFLAVLLLVIVAVACSRERRYELEGQVLAVDPAKGELTVRHKDIKGFMPGMTMPFKVIDPAVLTERKPGDLIRATLVVADSLGRLDDVVRVGEAPLPADAAATTTPTVLDVGAQVPDATLLDQDGRPRRISEWQGKTIAVTFVYTRCPMADFCPLIDKHFAAAQGALKNEPALADRAHLVSVSFDPDHDTPQVLRAHATRLGADPAVWTWLTGTPDTVGDFTKAFGISLMRSGGPAGEIVHNLRTVVVNREGRVGHVFNGNSWRPEELVAALRTADGR
jgi:protein SCO1/2